MARKKFTPQQMKDGFKSIQLMMTDPYSKEADEEMDRVAADYNSGAFEFVAASGQIMNPRWPKWHRLLQVRFIRLMCEGEPNVAGVIQSCLASESKPEIDILMREAIRQSLLDILAWGKAKKEGKRVKRPRRSDQYWHDAFSSLNDDVKDRKEEVNLIDSVPKEEFAIFGTDYSL